MKSIRAFFGIPFPAAITKKLIQSTQSLQNKLTHPTIQWSSPKNLHITLQFLKSVDKDDIPSLIAHAQQQIKTLSCFSIVLGNLELFPSPHRPQVISLHIPANQALNNLAMRVGQGIVQTGYAIEQRPYRPHVTLGRLRTNTPLFLPPGFEQPCDEAIAIQEICLWESQPSQQGSHYVLLGRLAMQTD